ncbi:FadR/GntR family transcriptional regulator [Candidatus Avoscillospira sp. LCP25S3_F1]|uniref:FadR/GntR family transcriptional regulator n=1 Tax=Candidatus Avoscillospira sp. LCP25S3_F1 TaxID=3438825 RepID=UPI003F9326B4
MEQRSRKKISRVSIVDQVCASIKQDIADGTWKEGSKLPSEAEFAELFGVNRLSVRMALQKLSTLGIIETRVGEGSYVKRFSLRPVLSEVAVFYEGEERYEEVRQLRFLLESECMRLALQKATDEEREQLRQALQYYYEMAAEFHKDIHDETRLDQVVDADFQFHYQVIRMSHNRLYRDIYQMVQVLIREHIKRLLSRRTQAREEQGLPQNLINETHEEIYRAIRDSNANVVERLCAEMLGIIPVPGMDIFD